METLSRRNILIGAGVSVILTGCKTREQSVPLADKKSIAASHTLSMGGLNQGEPPWEEHPNLANGQAPSFDPTHIGILHMELFVVNGELKLVTQRAHFPRDTAATTNDLAGNMPLIARALSYLNAPQTHGTVPHMKVFPGLNGYSFVRPTHCIIYVKNAGITYAQRPVWFGDLLSDGRPAEPNHCFFGATPRVATEAGLGGTASIADGSQDFVYMKNYFHGGTGDKPVAIGMKDKLLYSLNINAAVKSNDGAEGMTVPIIIDPDTGNMGAGGDNRPPFLTA